LRTGQTATALVALTGFSVLSANVPNRVADFLQHHVNLVIAAYTSGLHMLVYALQSWGWCSCSRSSWRTGWPGCSAEVPVHEPASPHCSR
jgi:hypothetical protein